MNIELIQYSKIMEIKIMYYLWLQDHAMRMAQEEKFSHEWMYEKSWLVWG